MCINVHEFASLSQDITACKAALIHYSASNWHFMGWDGETANKQMLLVQTNCSNKQLNWKDPMQCTYINYIYYIDKSVLVENRPLVKFSISSLVRISMTSFPTFTMLIVQKCSCLYNKKKISFYVVHGLKIWILFSRGKNQLYFPHSLCSFVKYCFYQSKNKIHIFAPPCDILYICAQVNVLVLAKSKTENDEEKSQCQLKTTGTIFFGCKAHAAIRHTLNVATQSCQFQTKHITKILGYESWHPELRKKYFTSLFQSQLNLLMI